VSETQAVASAFRLNDLSRRWVAFEMAHSLPDQAPPTQEPPAASIGLIDVTSARPLSIYAPPSITVPAWMRSGLAFSAAASSLTSDCSALTYRPSGFLGAATEFRRANYYGVMSSIACQYGIPVGLFDAMILRESGYQAGAFSPKKAFGLTQLMPGTAFELGVNRYDLTDNLRGGARYLRTQLDRFGQVHLALAAYNAGPARVRNGQVPRIAETQAYIEDILFKWRRLSGSSRAAVVQPSSIVAIGPETGARSNGRFATISTF
jgi:soluble lytic murein transglycosylase-like protein